jgi:hypothetical protein
MPAILACKACGNTGKPELPRVQAEEPQRAVRDRQKHATYSISFESCLSNTGSSPRDAKADGKVGGGVNAPLKSQSPNLQHRCRESGGKGVVV